MEEYNKLMNLKLHEGMEINNGYFYITRVVGGWIYDRQEPQVNISNVVFIPITSDRTLSKLLTTKQKENGK
jgi:hypothetical protein